MKKYIFPIVGLLFVGALLVLWFSAPNISKWYILKNYPYITSIDKIDLNWKSARLYGVFINKENIKGNLNYIKINTNKEVEIVGGKLSVEYKPSSTKSPKSGWKIKASELDVEFKYKDIIGNAKNTSYSNDRICFDSGKVSEFNLNKGCVDLYWKRIYIQKVNFNINMPYELPYIDNNQAVSVYDVDVFWKNKLIKFREAKIGDLFNIEDCSISLLDEQYFIWAARININHKYLSQHNFDNVSFYITKNIDSAHIFIGDVFVGVEKDEKPDIRGSGECKDWLSILSNDTKLKNVSGSFEFEISINPVKIRLRNKCKAECKSFANLMKSFSYKAYNSKGKRFTRKTGLNDPTWVYIETLPDYISEAFIRMEDPGFRGHRGVLRKALEISLDLNLKNGRIVRGGSTITMQLVKNLYLDRGRTLDRKLQEMILAPMLESCFTKEQILEFYINVVEFGPDIYGIRGGAWHYFEKKPQELLPEEAIYLARVLCNPNKPRNSQKGLGGTLKMIEMWKETGILPEDFGKNNEKIREEALSGKNSRKLQKVD